LEVLGFICGLCFIQKYYDSLTGSAALTLEEGRNMWGLIKADCRPGREIFPHRYTIEDDEIGKD